eukprot:7691399-Ditylum_brightwellii.AAC.1
MHPGSRDFNPLYWGIDNAKPSPMRVPVGRPLGKLTTHSAYSLCWTTKLSSLVWIGIFSWLCAGHMTSSSGHGE